MIAVPPLNEISSILSTQFVWSTCIADHAKLPSCSRYASRGGGEPEISLTTIASAKCVWFVLRHLRLVNRGQSSRFAYHDEHIESAL